MQAFSIRHSDCKDICSPLIAGEDVMYVETVMSTNNPDNDFKGKGLTQAQIVLYFLSPQYPAPVHYIRALKKAYPAARLVGCTTGGEIFNTEAFESTSVSVAMQFNRSEIEVAEKKIATPEESLAVGMELAERLNKKPGLKLIYILSDGMKVTGSALVQGLVAGCGKNSDVVVAGGLAGDGTDFRQTGVGVDNLPQEGNIAAIGFYGDAFQAACGSVGGWVGFGPERVITKSAGNILYELDGTSALTLYKKYLGEDADKLPGSALLFPLSLSPPHEQAHSIVRTPFAIDEETQSLVFSDTIPQGYVARMMHGSLHNMLDGAAQAAAYALEEVTARNYAPSVALLVSCIGRNMMMGQRVSAEVGTVRGLLGDLPIAGFYSYGEICPHPVTRKCDLHNQTMAITLLGETA